MLQMTSSDVAVPLLLKKYELSLSSGKSMFRVSLCQLHAHTRPVLVKVVCRCFRIVYILLKHDVVRQVTEFHLSTKFHVCQCCG